MADNKMKGWQIALVAGLILIVPVLIVFQLTKADINIDDINPTFSNGCNTEGTICTYNMDSTAKVIILTEDEQSWRLTGNCVDTVLEQHIRNNAVVFRDGGAVIAIFPNNPEQCLDLVIFDKDNWNRENKIIQAKVQVQCITTPCDPVLQDFEINTFSLSNVVQNEETTNFIEQLYGD